MLSYIEILVSLILMAVFFFGVQRLVNAVKDEVESNKKLSHSLDQLSEELKKNSKDYSEPTGWKELEDFETSEIFEELKDRWISAQANSDKSVPFLEWIAKEVNHG